MKRQNETDVGMAVFWARQCPQQCSSATTHRQKRKPDISFLRTFGCVGPCQGNEVAPIQAKGQEKANSAPRFEAASKAYQLFNLHRGKVVISHDVVLDKAT